MEYARSVGLAVQLCCLIDTNWRVNRIRHAADSELPDAWSAIQPDGLVRLRGTQRTLDAKYALAPGLTPFNAAYKQARYSRD